MIPLVRLSQTGLNQQMKSKLKPHRFPIACLIVTSVILVISGIDPYDRFTWWLEIAPILIVIPLLTATYQRFRLTNLLYALIVIHALILAVGGHYTYARVPWFDWIRDYFEDTRNSYDGIGHLAQGFIPAIAIRELLLRTSPLKSGKWMTAIIIFACFGIGAIYEVLEWLAAFSSGDQANDFLGAQGDEWDTQKDMLLAGIGAGLALLTLSRTHDKSLKTLIGRVRKSH